MLGDGVTNIFDYDTIHSFNNTTQFICKVEKQREVKKLSQIFSEIQLAQIQNVNRVRDGTSFICAFID